MIIAVANIAAAVALLVWSVRMVRTGVERGFSTELRRTLRGISDSKVRAVGTGFGTAIVMQSATAVALMSTRFAASGLLASSAALALLLGAELGSAAMARVLLLLVAFWKSPYRHRLARAW